MRSVILLSASFIVNPSPKLLLLIPTSNGAAHMLHVIDFFYRLFAGLLAIKIINIKHIKWWWWPLDTQELHIIGSVIYIPLQAMRRSVLSTVKLIPRFIDLRIYIHLF